MPKTYKQISDKYEELVKDKTAIVKQRDSQDRESFAVRIAEINGKMSTIDWIFDEVDDI